MKVLIFAAYIFWTITDNWEWADGYCPKFGLFSVDRENNFERIPRDSFFLFKDVVSNKKITYSQRDEAWNKIQSNLEVDREISVGAQMPQKA